MVLEKVVDDPEICFSILLNFPPFASDAETDLFRAIRSVSERHEPQAPVVPSVLGGFTDAHFFRRKGIASYGFIGLATTEDDARRVHGTDERLSLASLRKVSRYCLKLFRSSNARVKADVRSR